MIRVQSTVYPPTEKFSFNEVQANMLLHVRKDIQLFNAYCSAAQMDQESIDRCLENFQIDELYKED